jgi:hypothetical protein
MLLVAGTATGAMPTSDPVTLSTAAPVIAAEAVTTLPLFGVQLTVDVSTTPDGSIGTIAVNPASGLTATKVRPNKVAFVNDAKTGKVTVQTRHGGQAISVRAGSLADISGAGGWSGDVFGTGTKTTVGFMIGAQADGSPDITAITSSDATAVIGAVDHHSGDHGQVARVTITFTSGIQTRRLSITAKLSMHDGESHASTQVSLSKVSGASLPADQVVGPHTWTGMLCDGTKASIGYTVAADGSIAPGLIAPTTATSSVDNGRLIVMFSSTESVRISARSDNGTMRVSAAPRLSCDHTVPSVNTPVSTTAPGDHHGGHGGDGSGSGSGSGSGDGGHSGRDGRHSGPPATTTGPATTAP